MMHEGGQAFFHAGKDAIGKSVSESAVQVGVLGEQIHVLGAEKHLTGHGARLAVVVPVCFWHIAHFQSVAVQAVDIILVFAIMVKERGKSAYFP